MAQCPKCGKENPGYVFYCGGCGTEIPEDLRKATLEKEREEEQKATAQTPRPPPRRPTASPPATYLPRSGTNITSCPGCGAYYDGGDHDECPACGRWQGDTWSTGTYGMDGEPVRSRTSGGLVAGGVMAILAGVLALGQGLLYIVGASLISYVSGAGFICFCGGIDVAFGLASIGAGIFALKRENFMFALVGAILGMLGLGLIIGFVLGLIAVILIASARAEFSG